MKFSGTYSNDNKESRNATVDLAFMAEEKFHLEQLERPLITRNSQLNWVQKHLRS